MNVLIQIAIGGIAFFVVLMGLLAFLDWLDGRVNR